MWHVYRRCPLLIHPAHTHTHTTIHRRLAAGAFTTLSSASPPHQPWYVPAPGCALAAIAATSGPPEKAADVSDLPNPPPPPPIPATPTQAQNYDPRRSNVKEEALAEFIRAPITGDLTEVSQSTSMGLGVGKGGRVLHPSFLHSFVCGPSSRGLSSRGGHSMTEAIHISQHIKSRQSYPKLNTKSRARTTQNRCPASAPRRRRRWRPGTTPTRRSPTPSSSSGSKYSVYIIVSQMLAGVSVPF